MDRAALRRPWYLLAAIVIAWLFGVGGCTDGSAVIGSYWSPMPDAANVASNVKPEDRENVEKAVARCVMAQERMKPRVFPLGVASFLLGAAMVMFAARAFAGRRTARSLLVQLVAAQAALVIARTLLSRDLAVECFDVVHESVVQSTDSGKRPLPFKVDFSKLTPQALARVELAGAIFRAGIAGLVIVGLTRRRSRDWFDAMEARRQDTA